MYGMNMENVSFKSTSTVNPFLIHPLKIKDKLLPTSNLVDRGSLKTSLISTKNHFLQSAGTGATLGQQRRASLENPLLKRKQDVHQTILSSDSKRFHPETKGAVKIPRRQISVENLSDDLTSKYQLKNLRGTCPGVKEDSFSQIHPPGQREVPIRRISDSSDSSLDVDLISKYQLKSFRDPSPIANEECFPPFHPELKAKGEILSRQVSDSFSANLDDDLAPKYQLESFREICPRGKEESFSQKDLQQNVTDLGKQQLAIKASFLSVVSTSLVNKPAFKKKDDLTRQVLIQQADVIEKFDPEFILKVALYTRQELNIRTTANFLLALAANMDNCKNYLRRYYVPSVRLPSDWIEVAEIYQTFEDKKLKTGSLPAMLRKEMKSRFAAFDEYQLGKYNKKKRKQKGKISKQKISKDQSSDDDDLEAIVPDEPESDLDMATFSIKRLIRLLHLNKPVLPVMSLLGKKYPSTAEDFRASGLPGTWDSERVGVRMKLPVPFTWETQLAEKGNNASVWESLLDSKKLPYMAMLRNLRNILCANVSARHNNHVVHLLSNKDSVVKSRQFPLSFYTAYKSVDTLETQWIARPEEPPKTVMQNGKRALNVKWVIHKKAEKRLKLLERDALQQYKVSLEKALEISVEKNLNPVPGKTLVICDLLLIGDEEKIREECVLLGLMCLRACEECELIMIGCAGWSTPKQETKDLLASLKGILLQYPKSMEFNESSYNQEFQSGLNEFLNTSVVQQIQLDNIILLTDRSTFKETKGPAILKSFLHKYRNLVNSQLLCVQVDVAGKKCDSIPENPLDVQLAGVSDQLLRFLAEKGTEAQVTYVENIDKAYQLAPLPKALLPLETNLSVISDLDSKVLPKWRTVRVFISSTFRDMHGERDILVRYVFPELRARCRALCVHVLEVDLRWGITQEEADSNRSLETCLLEVSRCQLFVGILGERYGTVPSARAHLLLDPELSWVREYPTGTSVTELEMHAAALARPEAVAGRAFFFIRDASFQKNISSEYRSDFLAENVESAQKMTLLKERVRKSGLEVYDRYPCQWEGTVNGMPITSGLESFGQRVLDNLWNAIQKHFGTQKQDPSDKLPMALEEPFLSCPIPLIGRENQVVSFLSALESSEVDTIFITGKTGCGKSAFLLYLQNYVLKSDSFICDIGEKEEFRNILEVFRFFWKAVTKKLNLSIALPKQEDTLGSVFWKVMSLAAEKSPSGKLNLIFDGVDHLKLHAEQSLSWIPASLNKNVKLILSAVEQSPCQRALQDRMKSDRSVCTVPLPALTIAERKSLVSAILSQNSKSLSQDAFDNQLLLLVTKRDAGYPLYIQMACRELRMFGLFDNLGHKIRSLPQTLPQLIQDSIREMEVIFGKSLVQSALCFICLAQEGLEEGELKILLSVYCNNPISELSISDLKRLLTSLPPAQLLPTMQFATLARSLREYLDVNNNNNNRFKVSNLEIVKAIKTRYLGSLSQKLAAVYHKALAGLFLSEADPTPNSGKWAGLSAEAFRAIPHHLLASGCFQELTSILCSLGFLSATFTAGSAHTLCNQLSAFAEASQNNNTFLQFWSDCKVKEYLAFLRRNMDTSGMCYPLLIQQALCEPQISSVYKEAFQVKSELNIFLSKEEIKRDSCQRKLADFTTVLQCISSDKDGHYVAAGASDGSCLLLEESSGRLVHSFLGHKQAVCSVCFVNTLVLCTASLDGTLSLWNVHKGIRLSILSGHSRRVSSCCSDSFGTSLVSAGWDHHLRLWAVRDGRLISSIDNKSPVNCVSHHPTQSVVASGDWKGKLKLWDMGTLTKKAIFHGHSCSITCIAFSNDGAYLSSGSLNGEIYLWSSVSGTAISKPCRHLYSVKQLAFSDTSLISAATDGNLKVWNSHWNCRKWKNEISNDKIEVVTFITEGLLAVGGRLGTIAVFSTDGKMIFSESIEECVTSISKYCYSASPQASGILVGTHSGHVKILEMRQPNKITPSVDIICYYQPITCLSSSRGWIYTGFASGQLASITIDGIQRSNNPGLTMELFDVHHGPVTSIIEISKKKLITCGQDKSVKVWDMKSSILSLLTTWENCHGDRVTSASFSKSLALLVTGSEDSSLKIWDTKTFNEKCVLDDFNEPVSSVQFVNNLIVCCGSTGSLGVWNMQFNLIVLLPSPNEHPIVTACFFKKNAVQSAEGKKIMDFNGFLVTVDNENTFSLRTPFQLMMNSQLVGHTKPILGCCLSKPGRPISTSMDRSLRWWMLEEETPSEQSSGFIHEGSVITAVDISVTGQRGLSADSSGNIALWDLTGNQMQPICHLSYPQASIPVASFANRVGTNIAFTVHLEKESVFYQCSESAQVLRETKHHLQKSEVTNISFSSQHESVVWADRDGFVGLTDDSSKSTNHKLSKDWILKVKIHPQEKEKFFTAHSDGSVELINATFAAQTQGSKLVLLAPDDKRFITSLDISEKCEVYVGCADGSLQILTPKKSSTVQGHLENISCVVVSGQHLFTASKDGTIKAWDRGAMAQIGQFNCGTAVTTLAIWNSKQRYKKVIYGTSAGVVNILCWWPKGN